MEESILISTKQVLGVVESNEVFDQSIITHINAAFSSLNQLGVGQDEGFFITSNDEVWVGLTVPTKQLHMVKDFIYVKVRLMFDPPATSFGIEAFQKQLAELEWRLNSFAEQAKIDEALGDLVEPLSDLSSDILHDEFEEILDAAQPEEEVGA